jgi:hypothetical protein
MSRAQKFLRKSEYSARLARQGLRQAGQGVATHTAKSSHGLKFATTKPTAPLKPIFKPLQANLEAHFAKAMTMAPREFLYSDTKYAPQKPFKPFKIELANPAIINHFSPEFIAQNKPPYLDIINANADFVEAALNEESRF